MNQYALETVFRTWAVLIEQYGSITLGDGWIDELRRAADIIEGASEPFPALTEPMLKPNDIVNEALKQLQHMEWDKIAKVPLLKWRAWGLTDAEPTTSTVQETPEMAARRERIAFRNFMAGRG